MWEKAVLQVPLSQAIRGFKDSHQHLESFPETNWPVTPPFAMEARHLDPILKTPEISDALQAASEEQVRPGTGICSM